MTFNINSEKDLKAVRDHLDSLSFDNKRYTAEIKRKYDRRTIDQNSLYWLWLTCIEKETGQPKEDLHEFFKMQFLGVKEVSVFNLTFFVPKSTTKLDTKIMSEYLDNIQVFAGTELDITLPDPSDLNWDSFYNTYKVYL